MNFLKNLFQSPSRDGSRNERQNRAVPPEARQANLHRHQTSQAQVKFVGLTPDQLAEALHWLSLY